MTPRRTLPVLLTLLAAAALVRGGGGCASEPLAAWEDSGEDAGAVADVRFDRSSPPDEDVTYPSPFEGWELYPDYDPKCGFYIPKSTQYLPPPIQWEPCRSNPETDAKSCRQMVLDWTPPKTSPGEWINPGSIAISNAGGRVTLMTSRAIDGDRVHFVADADGPVHVAVRQTSIGCALSTERSDGDYYAYRVFDSEAKGTLSEYGGGAIGGRFDALRPTVLKHYHDDFFRGFIAGNPGLLEVSRGKLMLSRWSDGSFIKDIWSAAQENGLGQTYEGFHDNVLFWESSTEVIQKLKVYTDTGGTKDFLGSNDDWSKGVGDIGTDGKDLVWLEGEGRLQPNGVFPNVAVVTAPFTTDPAQIQKRVLRTDFSGYSVGVSPFLVGCGYAVRSGNIKTATSQKQGSLLVRLADGYAWYLPDGPSVTWGWRRPLAITCEELFIYIADRSSPTAASHGNIARVRIDSLGPAMPP